MIIKMTKDKGWIAHETDDTPIVVDVCKLGKREYHVSIAIDLQEAQVS
jgi:hypothetical protein